MRRIIRPHMSGRYDLYPSYFGFLGYERSVAVAWSVESLTSNPSARVRFPAVRACQAAGQVRSPVGTKEGGNNQNLILFIRGKAISGASFLGEVFSGFFLICTTNVGKL